jgi:hypothetical protein
LNSFIIQNMDAVTIRGLNPTFNQSTNRFSIGFYKLKLNINEQSKNQ